MKYRLARGMAHVDSARSWARLACASPQVLWLPGLATRSRPRAERWWARRVVGALDIDLRIDGAVHVDPAGTYVVVALHESALDPVALLHLPLDMRFVFRAEILGWPYFGRYLRASDHVPIGPEAALAAYRRLRRAAAAAAADRTSLVVFPQGSLLGIETGFHTGPFEAAARAGLSVLPVVLTGGHRVWDRPFGPALRRGQPMGMRVLPPVPAAAIGRDGPEAVRDRVEAEMKAHALDGSMPAPRRFDPDRDGFWDGYRYRIDPAFPELADRVARHRRAVSPTA